MNEFSPSLPGTSQFVVFICTFFSTFSVIIQRRNAAYGTRCPAHEYGTPCAGHRVPYAAAVKDPNPVNGLLNALGIFLI